jgi:fumarylacetoacetate (FAA) hydrolase
MKLATQRDGTRDGALLIVSSDLTRAVSAKGIAPTLQAALDDWGKFSPMLMDRAGALAAGKQSDAFALDLATLAAPLPRCFGWIDSSVYLNHMELARSLRGATVPEAYRREPMMSIRMPSPFLAAHDDLTLPSDDVGLDIEGEVAVITGDVAAGASPEVAGSAICLIAVVSDTSLRTVFAREVKEGKTTYHGKTLPAMAPVVATPDELGAAWDGGRVSLPLLCHVNGQELGRPNAGHDMSFDFREIIAVACTYRPLCAGTVIAAGTVSNRDRAVGSACIAERRMIETLEHGAPRTAYLGVGDSVSIDMRDPDGRSIFGAITQRVARASQSGRFMLKIVSVTAYSS